MKDRNGTGRENGRSALIRWEWIQSGANQNLSWLSPTQSKWNSPSFSACSTCQLVSSWKEQTWSIEDIGSSSSPRSSRDSSCSSFCSDGWTSSSSRNGSRLRTFLNVLTEFLGLMKGVKNNKFAMVNTQTGRSNSSSMLWSRPFSDSAITPKPTLSKCQFTERPWRLNMLPTKHLFILQSFWFSSCFAPSHAWSSSAASTKCTKKTKSSSLRSTKSMMKTSRARSTWMPMLQAKIWCREDRIKWGP